MNKFLYLYALGNSYTDMHQLKMLYGVEMSTGTITAITDEVYSELSVAEQEVRNNVHSTVLDGIYFTSREENVSKRGLFIQYTVSIARVKEMYWAFTYAM